MARIVSTLLKCSLFVQGVLSTSTLLKCNQDDCLRAFQHTSLAAASYCATYTATGTAVPAVTPAFVVNSCTSQPTLAAAARVSSACTCLGSVTPSSTPLTSTSSSSSSQLSSQPTSISSSSSSQSSSQPTSTIAPRVFHSPDPRPGNLVLDPDFEIDPHTGWNFYSNSAIDSIISYSGMNSTKLTSPAENFASIIQYFDFTHVPYGTVYYFSLSAKADAVPVDDPNDSCGLYVGTYAGSPIAISGLTSFDWTTFSGTYTHKNSAQEMVDIELACYGAGSAVMWIDNIYWGPVAPS